MKISELIAMLETVKDENGDLETGVDSAEVIRPEDYDMPDPEVILCSGITATRHEEKIGPRSYYYKEDGVR